jgi:predicted GH43/DUF377 family glycosyl hydrolase
MRDGYIRMKAIRKFLKALATTLLFAACASGVPELPGNGNWSKYAGNPVLMPGRKTPGAAIGNDYYNLSDPCVIKDAGVYKIWYTSSGKTAAIPENHCSISYAESPDGISWSKNAGNPVLDASPASWDAYAVETVTVLLDADEPDAARRYKMWYAGRTSEEAGNPAYDIGYAWSADGKAWTKHPSPVMARGTGGAWDNRFLEGPSVIKDGETYKMWYAAMDAEGNGQASDGKVCIGYAESDDGIEWNKRGEPVMLTGGQASWDFVTVQDPCVLKIGGAYYLWYGGKSRDVKNYGQVTGFAKSSDGIVWVKSDSNPAIGRGDGGSWDAVTASFGSVILDGGALKIWYTGMDRDYDPPLSVPDYWEIGYAVRELVDGDVEE